MDFLSFELLVQAVRTMLKEFNWWWEGSVISCKSDTECNLEIKVVCCDHEEFLGNNSSFSLTMWVFSSVFNTADVNVQRVDRLNKGDWQVQYQKCKWSCRGTIFFLFLLFSVTSYHKYKILIFFLFFGHRELTRMLLMYLHWFCLSLWILFSQDTRCYMLLPDKEK